MSGGSRYWNEEAQRWEDPTDAATAAPVTPPPPGRPGYAPGVWPSAPTAPEGPDAAGTAEASPKAAPGVAGAPAGPPPDGALGPVGPASSAGGRPGRRAVWSVIAGVAAAGVAVALVLTLTGGDGDGDEKQYEQPTAAATASAEPTQDPSEAESPGISDAPSAAPPEGYEALVDDEGFRIAVPQGWTRSAVESAYGMPVVSYRETDGSHRLQVYEVAEASPRASFKLFLSDETVKPDGFQELALENLDEGNFVGSRLEYLADSLKGEPDVGTWHVYDQRFVSTDGHIYAIAAYGPDDDGREDELKLLTYASAWFCPPGAECSAPALAPTA